MAEEHNIIQDSHGFIWIGAYSGLFRFDGYELKPYPLPSGPKGELTPDQVSCLYEDRAGDLWVGSTSGLHRLNRQTGRFQHYSHDPSDSTSLIDNGINEIVETRDGRFWIGTGLGLELLDRRTGVFTHYRHDPPNPDTPGYNNVATVFEDHTGILWAGLYGYGLAAFDLKRGLVRHYRHDPSDSATLCDAPVHSLLETSNGMLWIGTWGGGLDRFDPATGRFTHFRHSEGSADGLSDNTITALMQSRDGTLWVGTWYGGLCFSPSADGVFHPASPAPFPLNSFAPSNITSLCEDSSGILWIGSWRGIRYQYRERPTITYQIPEPRSRLGGFIRALVQDRQGRLWVGTWGGLTCLDPARKTSRHYRHLPGDLMADSWVHALSEDSSGNIWMGSSGGIFKLNPRTEKFTHYPHDSSGGSNPPSLWADVLHVDRAGTLWAEAGGVLWEFDPRTDRFRPHRPDTAGTGAPLNWTYAICDDTSGILWLGTPLGLVAYDRAHGTFRHYEYDTASVASPSGLAISALLEDRQGGIWVRLYGGGLDRFDKKTGVYEHFFPNRGNASGVWNLLRQDKKGNIWFSTGPYILCLDPVTRREQFYSLPDEGNPESVENPLEISPLGDDRLLLSTFRGLVKVRPDSARRPLLIPPIAFTSVRVAGTTVNLDSALAESNQELRLAYPVKTISIDFALLDFADPSRNLYVGMMQGVDRDWVQYDWRHSASYANLDPGDYLFRVRGRTSGGLWNEHGASLRIVVVPPFWKTWWFITFLWAAALGTAAVVFRLIENRRVRMRTHALEEQHALERERLRISSDLHDELASNLTSIAMLSRIVRDEPPGLQGAGQAGPQQHTMLERITTLAQESVDSIRDIIWAIDPKAETLAGLLGRLRDMIVSLCRAKSIRTHVELPSEDQLPQGNLAPEFRQHLWFLLKEALTNAVKHSGCSELWLCVEYREEQVRVMVRDNGRGFDAAAPSPGKGRATMRMRAEKLGARLDQQSTPGAGTSVTVSLHLPK